MAGSTLPRYTLADETTPCGPRGLSMLRRDVSFVPVSPRKPLSTEPTQVMPDSCGHRKRLDSFSMSDVEGSLLWEENQGEKESAPYHHESFRLESERPRAPLRTTEQKKVLLGELLGNVDALVEGVRKAGIWGLD